MFGRTKKPDVLALDEPIEKVLESLKTYDTTDAEFSDSLEYLERLAKLKSEKDQSRVDPNQIILVVGNLVGILVVVAYEQKHVWTSKAKNFELRAK